MESKRKADRGAPSDGADRSAKRRKTADFDLSRGESAESTTVFGLSFLDTIRRTMDKSGRHISTYFEELPPKQGNAEYYRRTKMPISLSSIEQKLENGYFSSLAELESYCKRMIANAKDFYPRSSSVFDDAERVRKALSNYMTKNNPAYQTRGYQALPTPLPPDDGDEDAEGDEEDAEGGENEDAEGDDDDDDDNEGEDEDEDEEQEPSSRRRSIVLKRRGPARSSRNSISHTQSPRVSVSARPDHQYEDVPYRGLSFQQAQEKIVEELIRYQEPEYDDGYFEPFLNLPPRALKDYYRIVTDPMSLKKLQKIIKGVQGRNEATGVSEFKSWAALQEKSQLLWDNAFYYNEEGSEIYELAQELEKAFRVQLKQAKAAVPEPTQPKIKLKVGQGNDTPSSKKITIHVGRGDSVDSPAPRTQQSSASPAPVQHVNGITRASAGPVDAIRSGSAAVASPSPSQAGFKNESSAQPSPALANGTPGAVTPGARLPIPGVPSHPQPVPVPQIPLEKRPRRAEGKGIDDALISCMRIQAHPLFQLDQPTLCTILPHPNDTYQSSTVHIPAAFNRVFIVVRLPNFLHERQYNLWTLLNKQPLKPFPQAIPYQVSQDRAFEVILHPGLNVVETHLVSAVPRSERQEGGPEVELEIFNVFVNVMRP